jgi:hypothetical protein
MLDMSIKTVSATLQKESLLIEKQIKQLFEQRSDDMAAEIGALLLAARGIIGYGNFIEWVKEHVPFSYRTAIRYIRAFETISAFQDTVARPESGGGMTAYAIEEITRGMQAAARKDQEGIGFAEGADKLQFLYLIHYRTSPSSGIKSITCPLTRPISSKHDLTTIWSQLSTYLDLPMSAVLEDWKLVSHGAR